MPSRRWIVREQPPACGDHTRAGYPPPVAFDEGLAERVRSSVVGDPRIDERKMFGGLCFTLSGHMCFGIVGDDLMVRVGPDAWASCVDRPHAREMDFTGRSMKGMVYVAPEGVAGDVELASWLELGKTFTSSLPPKQ
jgi:hypothetical protein